MERIDMRRRHLKVNDLGCVKVKRVERRLDEKDRFGLCEGNVDEEEAGREDLRAEDGEAGGKDTDLYMRKNSVEDGREALIV